MCALQQTDHQMVVDCLTRDTVQPACGVGKKRWARCWQWLTIANLGRRRVSHAVRRSIPNGDSGKIWDRREELAGFNA